MGDVKWIKITTGMFEDEKIDFIESLPEADSILVIWIKLLTLAGKCNADGFIFLTEKIPYTDEMLVHKFRRPRNVVTLAMETFKNLGMVNFDEDGFLKISNWEKHQNIAGLDKIREQNRLRVAKHREKQKVLGNVTGNVTVTPSNAIDIEEDKELDIDIYKDIVEYLNQKTGSKFKHTAKATQRHINGRLLEGYTLEDFKMVIDKKVTEWKDDVKMANFLRPETLFGTKFEGYLNQKEVKHKDNQKKGNKFSNFQERSYDYGEIERKLANKRKGIGN